MLGRIVSMLAGRSLARAVGGTAAGPAGLVMGAVLPAVARRLGPAGMVAVAVGGYAWRKFAARRAAKP